jgi:hypothetical protein
MREMMMLNVVRVAIDVRANVDKSLRAVLVVDKRNDRHSGVKPDNGGIVQENMAIAISWAPPL